MKKLTIIFGIAIIGLLLFTTSCGSSSPSDVVISYMNDYQNGDYDDVIDALASNGEEISEEDTAKLKSMLAVGHAEIEEKGGIKSMEVIEESINDDATEAKVNLKIIYENGDEDTETTKLVKQDGAWKITM